MGVTNSRPTWLLAAGLVMVFAGWRVFDGVAALHLPLVVLGVACVLLATGARFVAWRRADGDERTIGAVFALGTAGCLVALMAFVPGTDSGLEVLDFEFESIHQELRFKRFFSVAAPILLVLSLLPVLGAQWAVARGGSVGALPVDALRLRESSANALSLGLAGAALMLIGYVTAVWDQTADFSFFKTSSPGDAVREIVLGFEEPLQVAFFFPNVNPVKDEALEYFRQLARATDRVAIEEYDRLADPVAAADYGARSDGSIFLRVGSRTEQIRFPLGLAEARDGLRVLDRHVQQAVLQLARHRRYVYLTTGHGERNDPLGSEPEVGAEARLLQDLREGRDVPMEPELPLHQLRQFLEFLNYSARDIGIGQGLGDRIPGDAAMVMIIAPQQRFRDVELNTIREYLDQGGSLLVALEPGSDFRLEELRGHLGIDYDPAITLDDDNHIPVSGTDADKRVIFTNRYSTHPVATGLGQRGVSARMVFDAPGRVSPAEDVEGLRTTLVVNTHGTSYQDRNDNFRFDEEIEERGIHGVVAAVERVAGGEDGAAGMRALVYADADVLSNESLARSIVNAELVRGSIQWLGREEAYSGEVVSEADVRIVHTRSENVIWFYAIIFGAPALVLGAGLSVLYGHRRSRGEIAA